MTFPFVSRERFEESQRQSSAWERRHDLEHRCVLDLVGEIVQMKRQGFQLPDNVTLDPLVSMSVDEADALAAAREMEPQ